MTVKNVSLEVSTQHSSCTNDVSKKATSGLDAIRQHISKQFETVHVDLAKSLRQKPQIFGDTDEPKPRAKKPVTLDETARIVAKHVVYASHRISHEVRYEISEPIESYELLVRQATKAVGNTPKKDDRWEVEG